MDCFHIKRKAESNTGELFLGPSLTNDSGKSSFKHNIAQQLARTCSSYCTNKAQRDHLFDVFFLTKYLLAIICIYTYILVCVCYAKKSLLTYYYYYHYYYYYYYYYYYLLCLMRIITLYQEGHICNVPFCFSFWGEVGLTGQQQSTGVQKGFLSFMACSSNGAGPPPPPLAASNCYNEGWSAGAAVINKVFISHFPR